MCKLYVNCESLFIERQCYIFMSLAQSRCAVAASSRKNRSNNMSTAKGNVRNVNVKNPVQTIRGVATGGARGLCPNTTGPTVSVLNIRDIAFYGCSEIIRTRNFTIFTLHATSFGQFTAAFHFF